MELDYSKGWTKVCQVHKVYVDAVKPKCSRCIRRHNYMSTATWELFVEQFLKNLLAIVPPAQGGRKNYSTLILDRFYPSPPLNHRAAGGGRGDEKGGQGGWIVKGAL